MNQTELTFERLRELLNYDPATGEFTWKVAIGKKVRAGNVAGNINHKGYRIIVIEGRPHRAHRLAWLWMNGVWPKKNVDHINRVRDDNRITNLREATDSENQHNRLKQRDNTSGHKGVSWHARDKRWLARIGVSGKVVRLGRFQSVEEAAAAYVNAAIRLHPYGPEARRQPPSADKAAPTPAR
jgi:hypothetical protein